MTKVRDLPESDEHENCKKRLIPAELFVFTVHDRIPSFSSGESISRRIAATRGSEWSVRYSFGDPVAEPVLILCGAHVGEGQHGDRPKLIHSC